MVTVIQGRNVNTAYQEALWRMKISGKLAESRNGPVMRIPGPVVTVYGCPHERMLLDVKRDANPYFHIFEGLWMLAGRDDSKWISQFNSNITNYAEKDGTFHGAYGYRWRHQWDHDQIEWAIFHLRDDPNSRRCVIQMFDPTWDQIGAENVADVPCNTAIYLDIVDGALNMTVTNRSNDMVWGCYGANAVHMSMLQEFVANSLRVKVGKYVQFSNNFHMYERHFPLLDFPAEPSTYAQQMVDTHVPMGTGRWERDLAEFERWVEDPDYDNDEYHNPFLKFVAQPMLDSWTWYKLDNQLMAMEACYHIQSLEVRTACLAWLGRRTWGPQT